MHARGQERALAIGKLKQGGQFAHGPVSVNHYGGFSNVMGSVIVIANQKGGVGKTTTAVNLTASLAAAEKRTLLVDCDPQGNATTGVGIERNSLTKGLYEFLLESASEQEVILETVLPGLQVIGSSMNLVGAEVAMAEVENREFLLRRQLDALRDGYDCIFLDCPPSLGFLTVNALAAADAILVPLQCEYYALEGLSQLLKTVKAVKKGLNPTLNLAGILLTMYDRRNNLSEQVAEEVRAHFKKGVFRTMIPRNVRLSEAPSHGKPILLYDIRSTGAQSYLALAKECIERGVV
jgi:chromosome partitioning protein